MKSIEELRELYDNKLRPNLESLEAQRKRLMKRAIVIIAILIADKLLTIQLQETAIYTIATLFAVYNFPDPKVQLPCSTSLLGISL